ncbi:aspartic peptidase domain-containing protein [Absidia repens]|uniref:rhizopuspepsin n=1 Tax=Absidia repens TaxID=90262 RepID=A0A1X2IU57_9FUNG|nr:aspartic peptidase domain-containing protein [Absidia repens]
MNLDTGSADIWIPSKPCQSCKGHNIFSPNESSTFEAINKSWSLRYGDGSGVMGVTAKDTIHIGGSSQPDQIIGLANSESTGLTSDRLMDGILGLSFPSLSYTGETKSIIQSMYDAGEIDEPVVGIYLGRIRDAGGKGEAVFGGVNPDHFAGDLKYIKVSRQNYWQVDFLGMEVGGHTISSPRSSQAIIDTGTTLTVLPSALSQAFHAAIPGAKYSNTYGWRVPCHPATNSSVTFMLGDESFPVPIADMIRERSSSDDPSMCFSGVAEANSPLVIMGDTFLRNYYSVYDFKMSRIGLAPSKA